MCPAIQVLDAASALNKISCQNFSCARNGGVANRSQGNRKNSVTTKMQIKHFKNAQSVQGLKGDSQPPNWTELQLSSVQFSSEAVNPPIHLLAICLPLYLSVIVMSVVRFFNISRAFIWHQRSSDVKASRPHSFWPRPRSGPRGIWPRHHRNWPRGLEYLQCTWH